MSLNLSSAGATGNTNPPSRADGFTLLEFVSVMLMLAVASAFAFPAVSGTIKQFQQRFFYDEAVTALRYARDRAITKQCSFGVHFGTNLSATFALGASDGFAVAGTITFDDITAAPNCVLADTDNLNAVLPRPYSREAENNFFPPSAEPFFVPNQNSLVLTNISVGFDPLGRPFGSSGLLDENLTICVGGRLIVVHQRSGFIETLTDECDAP